MIFVDHRPWLVASLKQNIDWVATREWVAALSGWAATLAAVVTVLLLQRQLTDTRLSNERQQRAYVLPIDCDVSGVDTGHLLVKITFRNYGQTPATKFKVYWDVFFTNESDDPPPVDLRETMLGVIAPGQERHVKAVFEQNNDLVAKLGLGESFLNVVVATTYFDAFGREHESQFGFANKRKLVDGPLPMSGNNGVFST